MVIRLIGAVGLCVILSSCKQYIEWGEKSFAQATTLDHPRTMVPHAKKSAHVYDQFNTVLHVDALWINQEVLQARAEVMRSMNLWDTDQYTSYLDNLLRDNAAITACYVLAGPDSCSDIPLFSETQQARWTPSLRVDGREYQPSTIMTNSPDHIYNRMLWVRRYAFRIPYIFKFPVITTPQQRVELILRSVAHEVVLSWNS